MEKLGTLQKTLILILVPALIIVGAMTSASYYLASQALKEQSKETMIQVSARYANDLNGKLEEVQQAVITTAKIIESKSMTIDETRDLLKATKASHANIANIFLGLDAGGELIDALGSPINLVDSRQRPWYKAGADDRLSFSTIYVSKSVGVEVFSISYPVKVNGKLVGVLAAEISKSQLSEQASQLKFGNDGYAFLLDKSGKFIYHPSFKSTEDIFTIQNGTLTEQGKLFLSDGPQFVEASFDGIDRFFASTPIGNSGDVLVLTIPVAEFLGVVYRMLYIIFGIGACGIVLLALVVFIVSRKMNIPLQRMVVYAEEIASGNLASRQQTISSQDELGNLHNALAIMGDNLRIMIGKIVRIAEQVAASSEELTANSEQSSQTANQVASAIAGVAAGTSEQLAAAQETTAVAEQMSNEIQQIAENTNQVAFRSVQAAEKAKDGGKSVKMFVTQMGLIEDTVNTSAEVVKKLGERSKEIGQIVDVISGIAGQTNLLALNAAIEAARAGEQGRGFAVVAEEVRKLAEQSQEAAQKIATLIGEIQGDTDKAVIAMNDGTREVKTGAEVVNAAGAAFREIAELVNQVSDQVKEIAASIKQMATGSQQIVGSVKKIDELSKTSAGDALSISAATEEQLASIEEIASSSENLSKFAQDLQAAVVKFRV